MERAEQYAAKQKRQQEYAEKELYRQLKAAKQEAEEAHIAAQRVIEQTKREAEAVIAEIKERNRKKDAALTPGAVRNRVDKLYDVAGSQPQVDDHYTCLLYTSTYLAVAMAVKAFKAGDVSKIILTRPAVEAGEKLGFLPGDLQTKVDPYLRPLYDALFEMLGAESFYKYQAVSYTHLAPAATTTPCR